MRSAEQRSAVPQRQPVTETAQRSEPRNQKDIKDSYEPWNNANRVPSGREQTSPKFQGGPYNENVHSLSKQ